jgi:hypothetical protein
MRLELQELRAQGMSEGFRQIGFQSGTGGYGHNTSIAKSDGKMLAIQSECQQIDQSPKGVMGGGAFFMTETEQFGEFDRSPPR